MSNALLKLDRAAQAEVEELLARLVATGSINPWIIPGAPGEGEVAELISSWLRELEGVEVTVEEVLPGRSNVLARVRGTSGEGHLAFNVHTDTVDCEAWPEQALYLDPRRRPTDRPRRGRQQGSVRGTDVARQAAG